MEVDAPVEVQETLTRSDEPVGAEPVESMPVEAVDGAAEPAANKPLKIKNIHSELTEEDIVLLFGGISSVKEFKFDERHIGWLVFEDQQEKNNKIAIDKFNGRKAMGKILVVEDPLRVLSLKDRLKPVQRGARNVPRGPRGPRGVERQRGRGKGVVGRERKPKPVRKTVEDLDKELSEYMNTN